MRLPLCFLASAGCQPFRNNWISCCLVGVCVPATWFFGSCIEYPITYWHFDITKWIVSLSDNPAKGLSICIQFAEHVYVIQNSVNQSIKSLSRCVTTQETIGSLRNNISFTTVYQQWKGKIPRAKRNTWKQKLAPLLRSEISHSPNRSVKSQFVWFLYCFVLWSQSRSFSQSDIYFHGFPCCSWIFLGVFYFISVNCCDVSSIFCSMWLELKPDVPVCRMEHVSPICSLDHHRFGATPWISCRRPHTPCTSRNLQYSVKLLVDTVE